jgi:hypothetical protein
LTLVDNQVQRRTTRRLYYLAGSDVLEVESQGVYYVNGVANAVTRLRVTWSAPCSEWLPPIDNRKRLFT